MYQNDCFHFVGLLSLTQTHHEQKKRWVNVRKPAGLSTHSTGGGLDTQFSLKKKIRNQDLIFNLLSPVPESTAVVL